jgi:hypothetical protein
MNSIDKFPSYDEVHAEIGDKVVNAMAKSVVNARADLATYRDVFPHFVSDQTERGLANWIHDRMWKHLVDGVSDNTAVQISDNGTTREIRVGINYRFRAKRHDEESSTRSYPTQSVIEFHIQEPTFDGLSELRLDYGYRWVLEERRMGEPVMSLRHGKDLIWDQILDTEAFGQGTNFGRPETDSPRPSVSIGIKGAADSKGSAATGQ